MTKEPRTILSKPVDVDAANRALFAAYLNMGRMNLYTALRHVSAKVGITDSATEDNMASMKVIARFESKKRGQRVIENGIYSLLPSLKVMVERTKEVVHCSHETAVMLTLTNLVTLVSDLRNEYTHAAHYSTNDEKKRQAETVKYNLKPLQALFVADLEKTCNRRGLVNDDAKKFAIKQKNWVSYYNPCTSDGNGLSPVGIVFLLCKLLTRKYAMLLLDQCNYFVEPPVVSNRIKLMKELFCTGGYNPPRHRVDTGDDNASIGLAILGELRKCPRILFDRLHEEDRRKLLHPDENGNVASSTYRDNDLFITYALRYIEKTGVMPNVAFQMTLGRYFYKFSRHTGIDGDRSHFSSRSRKVNGFGHFSSMEAKRVAEYRDSGFARRPQEVGAHSSGTKPYISDGKAEYLIAANRVGLFWNDENHRLLNSGIYFPQHDDGGVDRNHSPRCWMSVYDLPMLVFFSMMGGNAESVVKSTCNALDKFFASVASGKMEPVKEGDRSERVKKLDEKLRNDFGLHVDQIPSNILGYLVGDSGGEEPKETEKAKSRFDKYAATAMENELRFAKKRRGQAETISVNKMARLIAHDILRLQQKPEEYVTTVGGYEKRLGRTNFIIMQKAIAEYREGVVVKLGYEVNQQERLKAVFQRANLLDADRHGESGNPSKHPFLDTVMAEHLDDVPALYRRYFDAKIVYLEALMKSGDYGSLRFLHGGRKKFEPRTPQHVKEMAERYRSVIQLPDGLFNEALRELMSKRPDCLNNEVMKKALESKDNSATYLISVYFKQVLGDDSQPFYSEGEDGYRRQYGWIDKVGPGGRQGLHDALEQYMNEHPDADRNDMQKLLREFRKGQRDIRRNSVNDILLFLMAKKLLYPPELNVDTSEMKLCDICSIDGGIMSKPMPVKIPMELRDEKGVPVVDSDGKPMEKTFTHKSLAPKDFGLFQGILYDTRVGSLLKKSQDSKIDYEAIKSELELYDNARREVFRLLHDLESGIIESDVELKNHPDRVLTDDGKYCVNSFGGLLKRAGRSDAVAERLVDIRNAFSHNKYPDDLSMVEEMRIPGVATRIVEWLKQYVQSH